MQYVVEQGLNALSIGAEYSLLALGLAIVFSIMGLVNFAHGELLGAGGYTMYAMLLFGVGNLWLIIAVAVLAVVVTALLLERLAFRPVRNAPATTGLLTAFGVSIVLQNLFLLTVAPRPKSIPPLSVLNTTVHIGPFTFAILQFLEAGVTAVAIALLVLFLKRTRLGLAMRAAAVDFKTVRLMGMRANRVIAAAFAISGFLAGLAAVFFLARRGAVDPFMGLVPVLKAFVACVLGGFGSLPGAVVGGLVLGVLEVVILLVLPQGLGGFRDAAVFFVVGAILVWRPEGLLGRKGEFGGQGA